MTWYTWLILAAFFAAFVAVSGAQPKGGRQVARTGLMSVARVVLLFIIVVCAYLAFRASSGG